MSSLNIGLIFILIFTSFVIAHQQETKQDTKDASEVPTSDSSATPTEQKETTQNIEDKKQLEKIKKRQIADSQKPIKKYILPEKKEFQIASDLFIKDKKQALLEFQRFISLYPKSPLAIKSQYMIAECKFQEAKLLKELFEISQPTPTVNIADLEPKIVSTFIETMEDYKKVIKQTRDRFLKANAYYRIAECYYNLEDFHMSIYICEDFLKKYWDNYLRPEVLYLLGNCYLQIDEWEKADSVIQKLIASYPAYAKQQKVLFCEGLILFHKEKYKEALEKFKSVETDKGRYYAGKCYEKMGQFLLAINEYRRLLLDYPKSKFAQNAYFSIAECFYDASDYFSSKTEYQRFIDLYPDVEGRLKYFAKYKIGCSYFQEKNYIEAIETFEKVAHNPSIEEIASAAQYMIGESHYKSNRLNEANNSYGICVKNYPFSEAAPFSQYMIGWCYLSQDGLNEATEAYKTFLKLFHYHHLSPYAYYLLGNSLYMQKEYEEALLNYQKVVDQETDAELREAAFCMLNVANSEIENYEQIFTNYQYMLRNLPPSDSIWRARSYLYIIDACYRLKYTNEVQNLANYILKSYSKDDYIYVHALDYLSWASFELGDYKSAEEKRQEIAEVLSTTEKKIPEVQKINYYETGNNLFNQKKYIEAIDSYERFIKEAPDDEKVPEAMYHIGRCYYRLEYYTKAIEEWKKLIEKYPTAGISETAAYDIADTYFKAGKYTESINYYQHLINNYPRSPKVPEGYLRIGQSYYNAKDYDSAVKSFQRFIALYPNDSQVTAALDGIEASIYRKKELSTKPQEGKEVSIKIADDLSSVLKELIEKYPDSQMAAESQFRIAKNYYDEENYQQAIKEIQKFFITYSHHPQSAPLQFYLAESYYNTEKFEKAIHAYKRYIQNYPQDKYIQEAYFRLGSASFKSEKFDESIKAYTELIKKYPDSKYLKIAQFNLGLAYKKAGKMDEMANVYVQYYEADPKSEKSIASMIEIAGVYEKQRKYNEAIEVYKKIIPDIKDERRIELQYKIADCYVKLKKEDEAIKEYSKLKDMEPKSHMFRLGGLAQLAEIYEKRKEWSSAIEVYNEILRSTTDPQWTTAVKSRIEALKDAQKTQ